MNRRREPYFSFFFAVLGITLVALTIAGIIQPAFQIDTSQLDNTRLLAA